jgi:hypothetical protein
LRDRFGGTLAGLILGTRLLGLSLRPWGSQSATCKLLPSPGLEIVATRTIRREVDLGGRIEIVEVTRGRVAKTAAS